MIPSLVAREVKEAILDYLETTFAFAEPKLWEGLKAFLLDPQSGLFKGPYVHLRLPFRKVAAETESGLVIRPTWPPYEHQVQAWRRLASGRAGGPLPTLVTTGTGSGKTECFLYPLLDHVVRTPVKGVKALILYPMNALSSDQARRFAETIASDPRLKGRVTVGLYIGDEGTHGTMGEDHVIDRKPDLRAHPPDILLTNYKMLDYLLLRPEDRKLWEEGGKASLRYLVLDELHTYDGAQGSDVACLLRRLYARLGCTPAEITPVGTSATLVSGPGSTDRLREFAGKIFGTAFDEGSVIGESRLTAEEKLLPVEDDFLPPPGTAFEPAEHEDAAGYLARMRHVFFGTAGLSATMLGKRLLAHALTRQLLEVASRTPAPLWEIGKHVQRRNPALKAWAPADVERLIEAYLALVAEARGDEPAKKPPPLLTLQVQFWVREIKRLLRSVSREIGFRWADEGGNHQPDPAGLPMVVCGDCGEAGWVALTDSAGKGTVLCDPGAILQAWAEEDQYLRFFFPAAKETEDEGQPLGLRSSGGQVFVDSVCEEGSVPIRLEGKTAIPDKGGRPLTVKHCPHCDTNGSLWLVGSQAASLGSVTVSHLFLSHFNDDKKLLAFTDSVQDASHRSGFFAARTYRFTIRTALQTLVQERPGISLSDLGRELLPYWAARWGGHARAVADFLPPDLADFPPIVDALATGEAKALATAGSLLGLRLAFEAHQEYGLEARPGRTLSLTGCSVAVPRLGVVAHVAADLAMADGETNPRDVMPPPRDYEVFLWGILTRLERRGAIWHPLLENYVAHDGKRFFLTNPLKKPDLLPSFFMKGTPGFLTDRVAKESGFESWENPRGWHHRWLRRSMGASAPDAAAIYPEALRRLVSARIVFEKTTGSGARAWCLDPEALEIVTDVQRLNCAVCGDTLPASKAEAQAMTGAPCVRAFCKGTLAAGRDTPLDYYKALYTSGKIHRIFPHEHTGLLSRKTREDVESRFKAEDPAPGAPNLLTCTPTLEMGVDIGDLSATLACSVPPTTSSHLQRAGRAGRTTGNALVLVLANAQPHDLYFFAEPMDLLAGVVEPPGCHLDAVEMLKRQFIAFAMDRMTLKMPEGESYPRNARALLSAAEKGGFPATLVTELREHGAVLLQDFLAVFGGALEPETVERLTKAVAAGDPAARVQNALDREAKAIAEFGRRLKTLREREKLLLDEGPNLHPDFKEKTGEFRDEIRAVRGELDERNGIYYLNWFTDAGLLPNYAFPEEGVKLRSLLRGVKARAEDDKTKGGTTVREYPRPASAALREFAPANTFYAEARKVVINQVETGGRADPKFEAWRFCEACTFMKPDGADGLKSCPQCGAPGFDDVGRVRDLLRLTRVSAQANAGTSLSLDASENRERKYYATKVFFEIPDGARQGGWVARAVPFGFEAFDRLRLREVNFGERSRLPGNRFRVGDEEVPEEGFELCEDCGVVRSGGAVRHAVYCGTKDPKRERTRQTSLYREMESEALRLLLPAATMDLDERKSSFRAAIRFGLRLRFGGRPLHLQIETMDEPAGSGSDLRRQYVVLYDSVPGGTGYLRGFVDRNDCKKGVLDILARAREGIAKCRCRREGRADGCYACVFGYEDRFHRPHVKASLALEMLDEILGTEHEWEWTGSLSDIEIVERAESDLEKRFLSMLGSLGAGTDFVRDTTGGTHTLIVDGRRWTVAQQVLVGEKDRVVIGSRPDFTIRPVARIDGVDAIHVFCDGFEYHACPNKAAAKVGDDIAKREAIRAVPGLIPWTVTWQDLDAFSAKHAEKEPWFKNVSGLIEAMRTPVPEGAKSVASKDSMSRLLAFLREPEPAKWRAAAAAHAADLVLGSGKAKDLGLDEAEAWRRAAADLDCTQPPASGSGTKASWRQESPLRALGLIVAAEAGAGRFEGASLVLAIDDQLDARCASGYRESWNRFLRLWNLFQWLPGLRVTSPDHRARFGGPSLEPAESAWPQEADPRLEILERELSDRRLMAPIRSALEAGFPMPEIGVDLTDESGTVIGTTEVVFRKARVAVQLEGQSESRAALAAQGWTVLLAEDVIRDPSILVEALGIPGDQAS